MKANQSNNFEDIFLQNEFDNIYNILNKVSFGEKLEQRGENIESFLTEVTASSIAKDDTQVNHGLNRVPLGFIVMSNSASGNIYNGSATNTNELLFLKSSISDAVVRIIVI